MATSTQYQWPSPRSFVSAYAQNLMSADSLTDAQAVLVLAALDESGANGKPPGSRKGCCWQDHQPYHPDRHSGLQALRTTPA